MEFLDAHPGLLAGAIFCARILDVSLGTLRTILVFRGQRLAAAGLGFAEVLIWVNAAAQVLRNLDTWYYAVAYAGGFAAGNVVGIWLESRIALGTEMVRAISLDPDVRLGDRLREKGYAVTDLVARGPTQSAVEVLFIIEKRRRTRRLLQTIQTVDPQAVCTLSDVRPHEPRLRRASHLPFFSGWRVRGKRK